MLDLTTYVKKTLEIKLDENTIVNLKSPNRTFVKKLLKETQNISEENMSEEDLDTIYDLLLDIFNSNVEGKKFTAKEIETYFDSFDILTVFFNAYLEWITDNTSQKN